MSMKLMGFSVAALWVLAGCPGRKAVQCINNSDCTLASAGECLVAATGHQWCAYPDPQCHQNYRYSNVSVGDDLGGTCTEDRFTLTLSVGGNGSGRVTSMPAGLSCESGTCSGVFLTGTQVTFSALPTSGMFLGWSDACRGIADCTVNFDQNRQLGALFGVPGSALWVRQIGGPHDESGGGIAADRDDNILVTGAFADQVKFDSSSLVSTGGENVYVTKLASATGEVLWAKRFGDASSEAYGGHIATDAAGNIYITGAFTGTIAFGSTVLTASAPWDSYLAKLTPNGDPIWARRFAVGSSPSTPFLAVKGVSLVMSGATVDAGGHTTAYLVKLTTDGGDVWSKTLVGVPELGQGLALDSQGNVVISNYFLNTIDVGGGPLSCSSATSMFLAKFASADGAYLFSRCFASGSSSYNAIGVDAQDNISILGTFVGTVDFGGLSPLVSVATNKADLFLVKYTTAGSYVWGKSFHSTGKVEGVAVSVNSAGDIAAAGNFCGAISFGGKSLTSAGDCSLDVLDIFAARFSSSDGTHLNSIRAGGTGNEFLGGIAQTSDGRFYVTGQFDGFSEFGGQALTSAGQRDAFILGLAPL